MEIKSNNFILTASRDENKNLIFTSAAGTVFNLVKPFSNTQLLDDNSIRKVKQAISFKQNVKITFEGVEYQQHKETGGILDPEDFTELGFWNAETESIDWEDDDAAAKHKCNKE